MLIKKETSALLWLLQQSCRYSPVTGELRWIRSKVQSLQWNNKYAGQLAFTHTDSRGYKDGKFRQVKLQASRVAWALYYGRWPVGDIDHNDGDHGNNRINNLRDVSETINLLNAKLPKNNKTGFKGVYATSLGSFTAMANWERRQHYLGTFDTKEEAYAARVKWYRDRGVTRLDRSDI